jgi:hypothetical protein
MQSAFKMLAAGAQLLAASNVQQARQLLNLLTTLEDTTSQRLLCWLLPQRRSEAAICYARWAALASISRADQVCAMCCTRLTDMPAQRAIMS